MITLVLGGARSGKSEVAERLALRTGCPVTYLATGTAVDEGMAARIEEHRRRRPSSWSTVECGRDLSVALAAVPGTALVDALGTWLASFEGFAADVDELCRVLSARATPAVVVSEEVGMGVHPSTEVGRHFRDCLGLANQAIAAIADDVLLVVAGRTLRLGSVAEDG
ncbi:MAG: bifunctional adenosylcobinamide kinase/adenosylcobinamide-phosphate guanylyltransferase [Acidimicrobiales bacterium]